MSINELFYAAFLLGVAAGSLVQLLLSEWLDARNRAKRKETHHARY